MTRLGVGVFHTVSGIPCRVPYRRLPMYLIDYFIECPINYHLEYLVVEYLTEDRLCNMPYVYLKYTSSLIL